MSCEHGDLNCQGRDFEKEQMMLKEHGFFVHLVFDDKDIATGANIHTHGFPETLDHPDIQIVLSLPLRTVGSIVHTVYNWIKEGNKIELEKAYDNILQGYNVQYAWAVENDRDVLRMILPDKSGETMKELMKKPYTNQWVGTYPEPQMKRLEI